MADINEALDQLAAVETAANDPSLFIASTGVRLRLKRVPQMILADVIRKIQPPKVPTTFIEEKGREGENPNDPDYIQALRNYQLDMAQLSVNTYFILGTKLDGDLPPGISSIASDDWVEMLTALDIGIEVPASGPRRYLAWLKYHALADNDIADLLNTCLRFTGGTLEADVRAAQSTFRGDAARDTSIRVLHPADQDRSGDQSGQPTGNGTGLRGPGSSGVSFGSVGPLDEPPLL